MKMTKAGQKKVGKVMGEYKEGTLQLADKRERRRASKWQEFHKALQSTKESGALPTAQHTGMAQSLENGNTASLNQSPVLILGADIIGIQM